MRPDILNGHELFCFVFKRQNEVNGSLIDLLTVQKHLSVVGIFSIAC